MNLYLTTTITDAIPPTPSTTVTLTPPPTPPPPPPNTRLQNLQTEARTRAQRQHAVLKSQRPSQPRTKRVLTKRQKSSKRSAEICRIKSQVYTELLEQAVAGEEAAQRRLAAECLGQMDRNMMLTTRIASLQSGKLAVGPAVFPPFDVDFCDADLDGAVKKEEDRLFGDWILDDASDVLSPASNASDSAFDPAVPDTNLLRNCVQSAR